MNQLFGLQHRGVRPFCASMKRNPRVYMGEHISVTRRDDGSLRLNFRPLKTDGHLSVERYALAVYNEICMALYGLVEEE